MLIIKYKTIEILTAPTLLLKIAEIARDIAINTIVLRRRQSMYINKSKTGEIAKAAATLNTASIGVKLTPNKAPTITNKITVEKMKNMAANMIVAKSLLVKMLLREYGLISKSLSVPVDCSPASMLAARTTVNMIITILVISRPK